MNKPLPSSIASEFHPTKNGDLKVSELSAGSSKKVWWLGQKCEHEWEASSHARTQGIGCAICGGRKILAGFNDLTTTHPYLASEWHPTKNGTLLPSQVSAGMPRKVWWQDKLGHEWEASIGGRKQGRNCPICGNRQILVGFNDLATANPILAAEFHPIKNEQLTPLDITGQSTTKVWWLCSQGHEWQATVNYRNRKSGMMGCAVCAGQKVLIGFNDFATTHPVLASEWHPAKNGTLTPQGVRPGSEKKVWWLDSFGHEWEASLNARTAGSGCPFCSGHKSLTGFNDLATVNSKLASEWHPAKNGTLTPSTVSPGARQKVWWQCPEGHEWEAGIYSRATGRGCPICTNRVVIAGDNDMATVNPLLAKDFHPTKNKDTLPTSITHASNKKYWWLCQKCNSEWQARAADRSKAKNPTGCPDCAHIVSQAETELFEYLKAYLPTAIQSDRKILKGKEIDIYIPEKKVGIEFNGLYWHSEEQGKERNYHYNKWLAAQEAGIQLIQIWEDDWNENSDFIKKSLLHKLGLSEQERIFARKTVVQRINTTEARLFLNVNHIQGYASGTYYLALKKKRTEDTIAVLVLKKEGKNNLNIIRYATNANVVGGFTKLLNFAAKEYSPDAFLTFSDHCISNGGLYKNNGFVADKELPPDYMYVVQKERKHKFGYRLKRFKDDPKLIWQEGLSERELADLNGIPRIWDSGKTRWVKENQA